MRKKSKLGIKFIYGEERAKIGKTEASFPIYTLIRYEGVKTVMNSIYAEKFIQEDYLNNSSLLRSDKKEVEKIIDKEFEFIIAFRDYIEEIIDEKFNVKILTKRNLSYPFSESIINFFNRKLYRDVELELMLSFTGIKQNVILYHLNNTSVTNFLELLEILNPPIFEKITSKKVISKYFTWYKSYNNFLNLTGKDFYSYITFRMLDPKDCEPIMDFKIFWDHHFDENEAMKPFIKRVLSSI